MSFNRIIVVGNLGADPELKYSPTGVALVNLSVACNRTIPGEKQPETQWYRATVWRKQAENCAKYLKKGSTVYIDGELKISKYGEGKFSLDIENANVRFLGGAGNADSADSTVEAEEPKKGKAAAPSNDDIPF